MSEKKLKMKVSGRFINLFGNQMYGGPVPSISEFIANAWDADAPKVEITLPDNILANDAEIIVRDYGTGMNFKELQEYYLQIGFEKRKKNRSKNFQEQTYYGTKGHRKTGWIWCSSSDVDSQCEKQTSSLFSFGL